jgi:hypothetical protein
VAINTHHRAADLKLFLESYGPSPLELFLSYEPEIMGTGGGLRNLAGFLGESPFLVINGDILTDLVGGLMGGKPGGTNPQGLDTGDLINAGLAYMQAKGRGEGNLQAIISGIISASPLGNSPARAQSAQIIAGTLLQKVRAKEVK